MSSDIFVVHRGYSDYFYWDFLVLSCTIQAIRSLGHSSSLFMDFISSQILKITENKITDFKFKYTLYSLFFTPHPSFLFFLFSSLIYTSSRNNKCQNMVQERRKSTCIWVNLTHLSRTGQKHSIYLGGFQLVRIEVGGHLIRQLCQHALGKGHTVSLEPSEGHKLDDVS